MFDLKVLIFCITFWIIILSITYFTQKNKLSRYRDFRLFDLIFHYSGLRYIWNKFNPTYVSNLPTGVIWLIGIYFACFYFTSQRYENRLDQLEYKYTIFTTQIAADVPFNDERILSILNSKIPKKCEIYDPISIIRSFLYPKGEWSFDSFFTTFENPKGTKYNSLDLTHHSILRQWRHKFSRSYFSNSNLKEIDLSFADFTEASITQVNFSRAIMNGTNFNHSFLKECNFMYAKLDKARFQQAFLKGTIFDNASLSGANFNNANLKNVSFVKTNLSGVNFQGTKFNSIMFEGAELSNSVFQNQEIFHWNANFKNTGLSGANFSNVKILKGNFHNANLMDAIFIGANLKGGNFEKSTLLTTNFENANLSRANFKNAIIYNTNLKNADLRLAINLDVFRLLRASNLQNAKCSPEITKVLEEIGCLDILYKAPQEWSTDLKNNIERHKKPLGIREIQWMATSPSIIMEKTNQKKPQQKKWPTKK